jgi:hypothetical protein
MLSKLKPPEQMWFGFLLSTINSFWFIALFFFISFSLHRSAKETLHRGLAETPAYELRLQSETNLGKLRHENIIMWNLVQEEEKTQEMLLRWGMWGPIGFGFILLINNVALGIRAHRLLLQHHAAKA